MKKDVDKKYAIIIGAGPAGLTAAYELLTKTEIIPVVLEAADDVGGISRTFNYKGNRIDIGGHRFFSKSDAVMNWWQRFLPVQGKPSIDDLILKRKKDLSKEAGAPDPEKTDAAMLVRERLSRIYFLKKFFKYPVTLDSDTISKLGFGRIIAIAFDYFVSRIKERKENSLEDFFINRFGRKLYRTFFKDYTEKLWGVDCKEIKPEWGAQRIKGLSASKAALHYIKSLFGNKKNLSQKDVETSLIDRFLYPKLGPGQIWNCVTDEIRRLGGKVILNCQVTELSLKNDIITGVSAIDQKNGKTINFKADYFFSSMPIRDLIANIKTGIPKNVAKTAAGLKYRDFITVGLLLKKLKLENETDQKTIKNIIPDNWIYIQERDVKIGRIQIFNNWSPYLVKDRDNVWIGLEYFCEKGDELWSMPDQKFIDFAVKEIASIGIIDESDVLDGVVYHIEKAYPAYFGSYDQFDQIKDFLNKIKNFYPIGRNGMHRYNNTDHSMLTAMAAVDNICENKESKENIWQINSEEDYHEEKSADIDIKNRQSKINPKAATLIGIFSLLVNVIYFAKQGIITTPDSQSYLDFANSLLRGDLPNILIRTFGYPLFLTITNIFGSNLWPTIFAQVLISTLLPIYAYLFGRQFVKEKIAVIIALVISLNPAIGLYSTMILTESIAAALVILSLWQHGNLVNKDMSNRQLALLILTDTLLVFVKPNLFLLPAAFYLASLIFIKVFTVSAPVVRQIFKTAYIGLMLNFLLIAFWSCLNLFQNQAFVFSAVSETNTFGKILQYDLIEQKKIEKDSPKYTGDLKQITEELQPENTPDSSFLAKAKKYFKTDLDPYQVSLALEEKGYSKADTKEINRYFLEGNRFSYIWRGVVEFPKTMIVPAYPVTTWISTEISQNGFYAFCRLLFDLLNLISPLAIIFWLYKLSALRHQKTAFAVILLMLAAIIYNHLIIAFFSYSEYARLRFTTEILLNFLTITWLYQLYLNFRRRVSKRPL